jgi:hypothetical protein
MDIQEITIFLTCFVALMAPILDYKFKKVPTWWTIPAIAIGLGLASAQGMAPASMQLLRGEPNLMQTIATLALVLMVFGPIAYYGGLAKEDLLLLLAMGSLNNFKDSMHIVFYIVCAGFVMAIFVLVHKKMLVQGLGAVFRTVSLKGKKKNEDGTVADIHQLTIPYSPAVACGVIVFLILGDKVL